MVSAHQAREFGLGLGELLTDNVSKEVNQRRKGKKCESVEDAKSLCPDIEVKPMLTSDPLMRHFHAGQNKDGHWSSSHAKLQLEDVTNALSMVHPRHNFAFKFDQSAGHTEKRKNGLASLTLQFLFAISLS